MDSLIFLKEIILIKSERKGYGGHPQHSVQGARPILYYSIYNNILFQRFTLKFRYLCANLYMYSFKEQLFVNFKESKILFKTLTSQKITNFFKVYSSFIYSRKTKKGNHWGFPISLGIEPTNYCNLRCPECPSGLRAFTRPTGMLQKELFQKLIDELHPYLIYLILYFQGEPYLHPDFFELVNYATKKNIFTATSTNAHYLTPENAERTVQSGLKRLIISIDGTTQETYQSYRVGGSLKKVIEGTQNIIEAKHRLQSETPFVIFQFLVVKPNEHQIPEIFELGKKLKVDKVALKTAQIYDYQNGNPLIPEQAQFSRYQKKPDGTYSIKNKLENQCWKLWSGAEITWDGRVVPCCFDKNAKYQMGVFPEQSFQEIWNNPKYLNFRIQLLNGRKNIDICTNCTEGTKVWET